MPVPIQAGPVARGRRPVFSRGPARKHSQMPNRLSWWRLPSISIAEPVSRSLRVHSREWNFFRRMSGRNLSLSACDPRKWAPNVWHHILIGMHRDANGVVTHDWVNFDGTASRLGILAPVRALPRLGTSCRQRPIPDRRIQYRQWIGSLLHAQAHDLSLVLNAYISCLR